MEVDVPMFDEQPHAERADQTGFGADGAPRFDHSYATDDVVGFLLVLFGQCKIGLHDGEFQFYQQMV